ncbi:ABC transporter ATP-binding protein [Pseudomarimonas arenosa]|uniref:ABC transporter ATP-binding protein n=1 Tax=Pseudomarimonas arenosa TaxID=2774145 RepID=A0AAW3ZU87_9GAMM|nr:ABC transporter ATP-binding protein [Pseudomarimonas arenosa]MBD8528029.1 ABC transporter ATP-binding protein [Pseudomarimonas arenosa]
MQATVPLRPTASRPLARLHQVEKRYGNVQALAGLDLQLKAGEVLALLGPNGAGKTTTIGLLTGQLQADRGEVELLGGRPGEPAVRRRLGVMLQHTRLPEQLRVAEQIRLFASYYPTPRSVEETLELSGLSDLAQRRYEALSGGQQRRLQFALAIVGRPDLLFVDEPTVGLDVEARRQFWRVLRRLKDEGCSLVLTTHYLEEADALADRIVVIDKGRVLVEGSPAEIKARACGRQVRCRSALDPQLIASWPEVLELHHEHGRLQIRTEQAETVVRRLLNQDSSLQELEVAGLALEDAFLQLTQPHSATEQAA